MKNSLIEQLPRGSRIAVIRLRSLGDCVLTTPAISLLKSYRPDLRIAVVVEDRFAGVFEDNPDIETTLEPSVGALLRWRSRLALNLHGGTRSMVLTAASLAAKRAGFRHHRYSFLYNAPIPRAQEILGEERPVHTAEHLASAMFWLGVPRTEIPRAKLFAGSRQTEPTSVIHPFASQPEKAWPADHFVSVANHLAAGGLQPLILAGPGDDTSPFQAFRVLHNAPLREVKNAISGAHLFVGNDSGPAHIAAAFGIPVVVLFGPSNPVTWAPWRTEARVLTSLGPIQEISTAQVIAAAGSLKVTA